MHTSINERQAAACSREKHERIRLCYIVTHAMTTGFLRGQLRYMCENGFDVVLIASPGMELARMKEEEGVDVHCVAMERSIRPLRDVRALIELYRLLRILRPHIVNAGTPKAGLLGMVAAWFARVPVRIYTLRGLRLETTSGVKRTILAACERVASWCSQRIVCVSHSLQETYVRLRLAPVEKTCVLGSGSSNGIDAARFLPTEAARENAAEIRKLAGIDHEAFVIGFVGRLARDKGVHDVLGALETLSQDVQKYHLLCVGDADSTDALDEISAHRLKNEPAITTTGFVADTAGYYHAIDVLALPSYREGFPNVAMEAAAAGLPVVAYDSTGTRDAVVDGVTGKLVATGDIGALAGAIARYRHSPLLRRLHGDAGQARAKRDFSQPVVWRHWCDLYRRMLEDAGLKLATGAAERPQTTAALRKSA